MDNSVLEKDISSLLGLTGLEGSERDDMLARIGSLVMESVLLRVIAGFNDEEALAFEKFAETNPEPEAMYDYMKERVPELDDIFDEEREAFREECVKVLGRQGTLDHETSA